MAFVSRYRYDVFVSYAHDDNARGASGRGWVSEFVRQLGAVLRLRLGSADVYFDDSHLQANQRLDELKTAARDSAVFLAIASRNYATRDWTRQELEAFASVAEDPHRLFAVEFLPLDEGEAYPEPLHGQKRIQFWQDAPHSKTPMPYSPRSKRFEGRIHDLVEQVRNQLRRLRSDHSESVEIAAKPASALPQGSTRTVLLAQVTEDLEHECDQLRRYLQQYNINVLPLATYPQDRVAFREAFEADAQRADLFVQLLGDLAVRSPPGLPEGYSRAQLAMATAHRLEILQWHRPDLELGGVADIQQRALLTGEHVMTTGFESFRAEVLRRATKPPEEKSEAKSKSWVFVNADKDDLPIAEQIQKEFSNHSITAMLPTLAGSAKQIRSDLEGSYANCNGVVMVYGPTSHPWVRTQYRLYMKMKARRSDPARVVALYRGPPAEKEDVGFDDPELLEIDATNAAMAVKPLIEMLQA